MFEIFLDLFLVDGKHVAFFVGCGSVFLQLEHLGLLSGQLTIILFIKEFSK